MYVSAYHICLHAVIICLHAVIIDHQHIVCEIGLVLGAAGLVVPGPQPGWPSVSRLGLPSAGAGPRGGPPPAGPAGRPSVR